MRTLCWHIERIASQQKAVRHGDWEYIQDGSVNAQLAIDGKRDSGDAIGRAMVKLLAASQ